MENVYSRTAKAGEKNPNTNNCGTMAEKFGLKKIAPHNPLTGSSMAGVGVKGGAGGSKTLMAGASPLPVSAKLKGKGKARMGKKGGY